MYLGFDLSTQSLSCLITTSQGEKLFEASIDFDCLGYGTTHGIFESGKVVTAPTLMFVEALDECLLLISKSGICLESIVAISGAAQQHGAVYWKDEIHLKPELLLKTILKESFAIEAPAIWMDSSTTEYCQKLEKALNGRLVALTGSRAYERFTACQIVKIMNQESNLFYTIRHVSLLSSFLASIFIGNFAPIDQSDGSGMNLMDITTKTWNEEILKAMGNDEYVKNILGTQPINPKTILGNIDPYFVLRYGFSPNCKIVAFTGDNPSSIVGLGLKKESVGISLGTSDTVISLVDTFHLTKEGHVMVNPLNNENYFTMLCFKNGSIVREYIRNKYANSDWNVFSHHLDQSPVGNNGIMTFCYLLPEITPFISTPKFYAFDQNNQPIDYDSLDASHKIRGLIEFQCMSMKYHFLKLNQTTIRNILITGGASVNQSILQILSNVFQCPIYRPSQNDDNSSVWGSIMRAQHALNDKIDIKHDWVLCLKPTCDIYESMFARFSHLESMIIKSDTLTI